MEKVARPAAENLPQIVVDCGYVPGDLITLGPDQWEVADHAQPGDLLARGPDDRLHVARRATP